MVCPPRSGSTLLEHMIGNSDHVDAECHEPFFQVMRHRLDPDKGYKQIYETALKIIQKGRSATIVVKEISCAISRNSEYERFLQLATSPIIFLIRNPLLSMESRINKILQSLKFKKRNSTLLWIQEELKSGMHEWSDEVVNLQRQIEGMSSVAKLYGYHSFDELLEEKTARQRDYSFFTQLLRLESERFHVRKSGFEDLKEQVEFVESKTDNFIVLDSTELRLSPKLCLEGVFHKLSLAYNDKVLSWDVSDANFEIIRLGSDKRLWYDTLDDSTDVKLPKEVPLPLSYFPDFVQHQLLQVELPIYFSLLGKVSSFANADLISSVGIDLEVTDKNIDLLQKVSVVPSGVSVGHQTVLISDIDPIYSTIRLSHSFHGSREYKSRKVEYGDIFEKLIELESSSL
ncbi:MAG: hypothetical protein LRZ97_00040 [Candidatus Pacebacteria bacterium]|nr:hypothetical protein [Candidatus Paceibacterota bacterium]